MRGETGSENARQAHAGSLTEVRARILVVEDEGIVARDLEKRLSRQGYEVCAVTASGEDAVRISGECMPDLILMDIVLYGDIDGIEAAAEIRRLFDIPVIYLTAYADDRTLERAKHTEPYGYIIKPFDDREVRSTIEMALYKHSMERKVRQSEEWLSTILQSIGDGVIVADHNGLVTFMNRVATMMTGWEQEDARGEPITRVILMESARSGGFYDDAVNYIAQWSENGQPADTVLISRDGTRRHIEAVGAPVPGTKNVQQGVVLVVHDVSEKRKLDMALRESEQTLRMRATELEERNTALKVLLVQREKDRMEVEENILSNVKQLVLPYLETLKSRIARDDLPYLNIVERNMQDIVAPFSFRLSSQYFGFTPREIAIADLIRDGKQDKDIMEILNIAFETVKSHRQNIRKKLGIYAKRTNLRSHLLSLGK